jgi:hypothetical protein
MVRRADGELELLDVPEEVLVLLGPRPRLGALDRRLSGVASGVRRERSRPSLTGCSGLAARDLA